MLLLEQTNDWMIFSMEMKILEAWLVQQSKNSYLLGYLYFRSLFVSLKLLQRVIWLEKVHYSLGTISAKWQLFRIFTVAKNAQYSIFIPLRCQMATLCLDKK